MLAAPQWFSCEASRKILMVRMEAEDDEALFSVPTKMLLETVDEGIGMETELMLPDESDDEKPEIMIEVEKKMTKQREYLRMDAFQEQTSEESKQEKHPEDEPSLSGIGEGDLLLEESKEEKWVGDKPGKKKEKYNAREASADNNSVSLTEETWQEEGEMNVTKEKAVMDEKISGQRTEDKTPANSDDEELVEGLSGEASLTDAAMETGFLLETTKEQDGSSSIEEEIQNDSAKVKATIRPEKLENKGSNSKTSDDETSEAKENKVEGAVIEKEGEKGGMFKMSKRKSSDEKDSIGEAMVEETPADFIEKQMQGEVEDSDISTSKARNGKGKKQERTEKYVGANENGDKEKPTKKLKKTKKPKLEVLQEADSEPKGSDANEKKIKTKVKKKKDSQSESEKGSDVMSAKAKQDGMEDTAKSLAKKKKKVIKEEHVKDKEEEEFLNKANEKYSSKKEKSPQKEEDKSFKKVEKMGKQSTDERTERYENSKFSDDSGGEDTQELKILEVVDHNIAEEKRKEKGHPDNKHLKRSKEELPNTEKQEEKLEIEVQGIAKEAQEKAEGSNSVSTSAASSTEGADEEEDEHSDFMQDFSDLSTKFQDTAYKVADHLGPNIQKLTDTSKTYFNKANQQITKSFSPLVGKQFAPFFASLVSYGLLLVPLAVVIVLVEHIRAILSLQKVVLFVNIYLAAYFATLLLATFIMGEPMTFFYRSSASGYVHLQLLQALGYIIYLILQTIDLVSACSSEAWSTKVTVVLQWFVAVTIGFHYYVTIFHRAMALKGPHTNWKIYGIYSCAFLVLCLFARIKRVKKGYVQVGQADTDKKH
ncbi:hypothetical protein GOP47_0019416 [Adiantum capillus-veneris]|uniref:Uncharacterized protein n=1 Tax=Adiantum capillus-veneris TaxID=13818 RepID=A0A9D4Z9L3_ADICA|nr:hypothetical protein GOP47_0019416 [Adiantum capillus-veneris]